MAYTPPLGNAVNFNATVPVFIPLGNAVNFNISSNLPVGISVDTTTITIGNKKWYYTEASIITFDTTLITLYNTEFKVDPVVTIGVPKTLIKLVNERAELDILPDIISETCVIEMRSVESLISGTGLEYALPTGIKSSPGISWKEAIPDHTDFIINWEDSNKVDEFQTINFVEPVKVDEFMDDGWGVLDIVDIVDDVNLTNPMFFTDVDTQTFWKIFKIVDEHDTIIWDFFTEYSNFVNVAYNAPSPNDATRTVEYDPLTRFDEFQIINWNAPGIKDTTFIVPWGPVSYFAYCSTKYFPPGDGIINFELLDVDPKTVNIGINIQFDVEGWNTDPRCPWNYNHTGPRDPYTGGGGVDVIVDYPPPLYYPVERESYYMLNTILVKRLPDNAPIEVTSISIKYDKQSWLWSFSLTIGKDKHEYLDLIKPDPNNANLFTDIEIFINGWKWVCRVESWNESRVFAKDSWTITGRSASMELGSPQNPKTSYIFDELGSADTAGAQIIDQILEGTMLGLPDTGWIADWSAYTGSHDIHTGFDPYDAAMWGIPPGAFSWTDKTQIEAIKMLTDSIGAFIITNPNCNSGANKKLIIRPKFDEPPWYWNAPGVYRPVINHVINTSYSTEVGRNYSQLATYTSVYVMGQNSTSPQDTNTTDGICVVESYRQGFGPGQRIYGADIVNPYLFNFQAASELGRMTLCETGEWLNHRLRLFSIANETDQNPSISRLILPGDFVQVGEKSSNWFGTVISTELTASVVNGSAFAVYQTIEVDQYIGE